MNGIVISIDPVAFQIGPISVNWFSLMIIVAIAAAVLITTRAAAERGIAAQTIYSGIPWAVLGGVVGARMFHVLDNWEYFSTHPAQIVGGQGMAIYGALVGGAVASVIYARIKHVPIGRAADSLAPGLLVGQMIGRVGCIINGDVWGRVTDLPWAFVYTHPDAMLPRELLGQPTHPYPVYEIIWNAAVLAIIWRLGRRVKKDWVVFLSYASLYSVGRFVLMFTREQRTWLWGLQQTQLIALIVLVSAVAIMVYMMVRQSRDGLASADTAEMETTEA